MTGEVYFFGARAVITVGTEVLAAVKGLEITPRFDFVEAYDNSSILRGDVSRIKARVELKFKYMKFNPVVASDWRKGILSHSGSAYTIDDTNEVETMTVTSAVTPKGGGTARTATVTEVYFESDPWIFTEDQYAVADMSGIGKQIAWA